MAQIDEAIEYLNDIRRGAKLNNDKFEKVLDDLNSYATRKGFSDEDLKELVTAWLGLKIQISKWISIGNALIPAQKVSDDTVLLVIHWILNNHYIADNASKVTYALSWLSGLLDCTLFNLDVLDQYYGFFFYLLYSEKYSSSAGRIIYKFTKSHDVTRPRVLNVLNLIKTRRQIKHYNSLLGVVSLFKSFRPECVPESIASISVNVAFPQTNKFLMDRLCQAQIRCEINMSLSPQNRLFWWAGVTQNVRYARKKKTVDLLPNLEYIQLGSSIYSEQGEKKKCLDFLSTHELMVHYLGQSIKIPANILSLLVNDGGLHILQFSDANLQSRFSQNLYQILYNTFLRSNSNILYEDKKCFLKKIALLQVHLLQGIPVVSRFLAQFVLSWNGLDFFEEILSLLEWVTFESFEELYDCILECIEALFLTSDIQYQCVILEMLKNMYINIHEMMVSERTLLFLNRKKTKSERLNVLYLFSIFIDELCEKCLYTMPDCMLLRHAFLDVYSAIADVQMKSNECLWSVIPMCLAYGTLCSMNGFAINRTLGLFLKYRSIYEAIKIKYGKNEMIKEVSLIDCYSTDYVNSLWYGKTLTWRKQGLMMESLPRNILTYMESNVDDADRLLDFGHHVAFAAETYMLMPPDVSEAVQKEAWLESVIAPNYDNIAKYIKTVLPHSLNE